MLPLLRHFRFNSAVKFSLAGLLLTFVLTLLLQQDGSKGSGDPRASQRHPISSPFEAMSGLNSTLKMPSVSEVRMRAIRYKVRRMSRRMTEAPWSGGSGKPSTRVHMFYYPWYRSAQEDGEWRGWGHSPPHDIASRFYPRLGCYSSRNTTVLATHMQQISSTGTGVIVVWGRVEEPVVSAAWNRGLRISAHLAPRDPHHMAQLVRDFTSHYGDHPAVLRLNTTDNRKIPVYYVYGWEGSSGWVEVLGRHGNASVRGTVHDGYYLALIASDKQRYEIKKANFDGIYTYSACNGGSWGGSWGRWSLLGRWARSSKLLFVPSVAPGCSTAPRLNGLYYQYAWKAAMGAGADMVSVSSFNDWSEGSQVEPAVRYGHYDSYTPSDPEFYLRLTGYWVDQYRRLRS